MKASRANMRALKSQATTAEQVTALTAKIDLILAHLGLRPEQAPEPEAEPISEAPVANEFAAIERDTLPKAESEPTGQLQANRKALSGRKRS